jgi:tRNA A37 threonylcarbamoyladenosine modification protein TsaB
MLIFAINTATVSAQIALIEADPAFSAEGGDVKTTAARVIWEKEWKSNYNEAEKILPAIKTALKKAEKFTAARAAKNIGERAPGLIKPPNAAVRKRAVPSGAGIPGLVFVVNGPGSFTGLRIGITAANCLAWAAGAGMEACTTFEYLRAAAPPAARAKTAVLLRAGGDFVAVAGPAAAASSAASRQTRVARATGPAAESHSIISISSLPDYFKKNKSIKYVLADLKPEEIKKIKLPAGVKWMPHKSLKSFGKTIADLLTAAQTPPPAARRRAPHSAAARISAHHQSPQKIIEPFYLQPPKITQSKKQVFTSAPAEPAAQTSAPAAHPPAA